jgi:adenine-specific DNA-methyltransferase
VADFFRPDVGRTPGVADRAETGQYLSPPPVARLKASSFEARDATINRPDAGAGTGSLSAAFVDELCGRAGRPAELFVTAFLTRKAMLKYLEEISWETEVWVAGSEDHL